MSKLILVLLLFSTSVYSEVFKWTDESGRIHYSSSANHEIEDLEKLDVKYSKHSISIPTSSNKLAISYIRSQPHEEIQLLPISIDMIGTNPYLVKIGQNTCEKKIKPIEWNVGPLDRYPYMMPISEAIESVFSEHRYDIKRESKYKHVRENKPTKYELSAKIIDIKVDWCKKKYKKSYYDSKIKNFSRATSYLKVEWTIIDKSTKNELIIVTSDGYYDGLKKRPAPDGLVLSITNAFTMATNNLLARDDFTSFIANLETPKNTDTLKLLPTEVNLKANLIGFSTPISMHLEPSDLSDRYHDTYNHLIENTFKIRTEDGQGSGILINKDGYILANASSLGANEFVDLFKMEKYYKGKVIRVEPILNVALIKLTRNLESIKDTKINFEQVYKGGNVYLTLPGSSSANSKPVESYLSDVSSASGFPFYSIHAEFNPRRLGGPAFNEYGELIAITSPGSYPGDDQVLGEYHLIPISEVLSALNITNIKDERLLILGPQISSFFDSTAALFSPITNWLNQPTDLFN